MKRMFIGLLAGTVMFGGLVRAQEFAQAPTDVPQLVGADLFIDLAQYAGKPVVITDGYVIQTDTGGATWSSKDGAVHFRIKTERIDRETFRFFLKNCAGWSQTPKCTVLLLATPTGNAEFNWPDLEGVKIVR